MKTIKQLADELGVSKTAVRNYMDDDFREKYTATDSKGVITISDDGCKVVADLLGKQDKLSQSSEKQFSETSENTENITIPRSVLAVLEEQLRQKDEQLLAKDKQIADLTEAVKSQAQSINAARHNELAGTMKQMLPDGTVEETKKKTGFFNRFKRNKED